MCLIILYGVLAVIGHQCCSKIFTMVSAVALRGTPTASLSTRGGGICRRFASMYSVDGRYSVAFPSSLAACDPLQNRTARCAHACLEIGSLSITSKAVTVVVVVFVAIGCGDGIRRDIGGGVLVSVAEHVGGLRERGGGICRHDLSSDCLLWRFTNFFKKTLPLQWVEMQFVGATRNQTSRGNARNSLAVGQHAAIAMQGGGGIRATLKLGERA
jgi:hypothetical protein